MVRADLPRGLQAAQIVHATGESVRERVPIGTHAVVLSVPDESALYGLAEACAKAGLANTEYVMVDEPDLPNTGLAADGQFTAIGFAPIVNRARLAPLLGRLPLLK